MEGSSESDTTGESGYDSDVSVSKQIEVRWGSDFALGRVPQSMRYSWLPMAVEQIAQGGCIAVVVIGAQLGHKMTQTGAFLAVIIGNLILAVICIPLGMIGCREGMTTAMVARWTGFGVTGTAILSLAIAGSLVGWFGIQAEIAGEGLEAIWPLKPWLWTVTNGAFVTIVAAFGFRYIVGVAWVTGPAFFVVLVWACAASIQDPSPMKQVNVELSVFEGIGIVVGGYIVGSTVVADVFRFSRSTSAVVSQVMLPRTLSIMSYMIIGLIVARACGSDDVIYIMNKSVGMGAVVIVVAGEMVINCTNLYFSGLAIVSIFDMCGCHVPRPLVTIVCGVIGTAAGALGILKKFITFLEVLAVAFPPVAGIISCEYFIVKAFRCRLDETRSSGAVPELAPAIVPLSLFAWLAASLLGHFVKVGMPFLYSLLGASCFYILGNYGGFNIFK